MHLTDTDRKFVIGLKKRQVSWLRWRWGVLLCAIANLAYAIVFVAVIRDMIRSADNSTGISAALVAMIACVMICIGTGVGLLFYSCRNWNGKRETGRLLRLINDSQV